MRRSAILGLVAITGLALPVVALLALPVSPASAAPTAGCADVTTAAVETLVDEQLQPFIRNDKVPGAVVSVVAGGQTVFGKGYGLADVARGVPMDAQISAVRIASISKLFTYTAVMQQVEAGKIDLGADVNTYLKAFKIPATYPRPITVGDLMNHTAGFEDRIIGTGAHGPTNLGEFLAANIPVRIRPPGEISAYSNYGAALAGYIVAQVSGEPYEQYVQRHILDPLGMTHSTATEPPPFAPARSYNTDETPAREVPFTFDPLTPDGSVTASADDMAEFMKAHLADGGKLLSPATAQLMHTRSFAADPRLGGFAHGFMDRTMNGHRVLMHDGGWEAFGSVLLLVPDCNIGLFASLNSTAAGDAMQALVPGFTNKFLPTVPTKLATAPATAVPAPGFYASTRHNQSTMEWLLVLLGPMRLTVSHDGTVHFKGHEYVAAGDGLYKQRDGDDHLVFRPGAGGVSYVATDGPAYERLGYTDSPPFNLGILAAFAVIAFTIPVYLLWRLLRRRAKPIESSRAWRASRWLAGGASLLGLVFLGLLVATLAGDVSDFIYGAPLSFKVLLTLPLLVGAAAVASLAGTVRGWSTARFSARVHQVLSLSGLTMLMWFFWQWNLLGWWQA
ncbi:serine hydrolase domain-containing protein [Dactylosporangium sp. McL0621]|uniref:serine hydrolase domain-containing protein n=1 Tax=Dactylosporangium sp. McL0621 TaxID=3415678 RepID=UPI003CF1E7D5